MLTIHIYKLFNRNFSIVIFFLNKLFKSTYFHKVIRLYLWKYSKLNPLSISSCGATCSFTLCIYICMYVHCTWKHCTGKSQIFNSKFQKPTTHAQWTIFSYPSCRAQWARSCNIPTKPQTFSVNKFTHVYVCTYYLVLHIHMYVYRAYTPYTCNAVN